MRSLIRYGCEGAGLADTFRNAVLMLFDMSILPLIVSIIQICAHLLHDVCHFLSQLLLKGDWVCRGRNSDSFRAVAPVMALIGAPLPC